MYSLQTEIAERNRAIADLEEIVADVDERLAKRVWAATRSSDHEWRT